MKKGKKYSDSLKLIDRTKQYDPEEAIALVKKTAKAKFDETVEISVRLGVDPRHADQQVRGAVVLPNGTGKTVRVLCDGVSKTDAGMLSGRTEQNKIVFFADDGTPAGETSSMLGWFSGNAASFSLSFTPSLAIS